MSTIMEFTNNPLTDRTKSVSEQPSDSPTERVFQFISDPKHKENLSGRVRAACVTCRRKKIKCSGEINCQTCREKGLVCEGLPERKRPKRNSLDSNILDPLPAGVDQVRRLSATSKYSKCSPKQRPGSLLRLADVAKSNDSGYGTSSSPSTIASSNKSSTVTPSPPDAEGRPKSISPAPFRVDIWDSASGDTTPRAPTEPQQQHQQVQLSPLPPSPTSTSNRPPPLTKRNSSQDEISWWNKPHHLVSPQTTDLSTAAQIVFGHSARPSSSLPKNGNKSRKPAIDLDGLPFDKPTPLFSDSQQKKKRQEPVPATSASRRQTVQFPIPSHPQQPPSEPAGLGLLRLSSPPSSSISTTSPPTHQQANPHIFQNQISQEPGIFDDMALLLSSTISAPSTSTAVPTTNPLESSTSPWWGELNDIASMLSQAGAVIKGGEEERSGSFARGHEDEKVRSEQMAGERRRKEGDLGSSAAVALAAAAPDEVSKPTPSTSNPRESPPNPRKVRHRPVVGDFYW